jgi:hypothetical protein
MVQPLAKVPFRADSVCNLHSSKPPGNKLLGSGVPRQAIEFISTCASKRLSLIYSACRLILGGHCHPKSGQMGAAREYAIFRGGKTDAPTFDGIRT